VTPKLVYDRGERRRRHLWNQPRAGFRPEGPHLVGKCDNRITDEIATRLLNEGIRWDAEEGTLPASVLNIFEGAVYVAVLTPGSNTYHGYPWRQRAPGKRMPLRVKRLLLERAEEQGCRREIERWIESHSS
jgi:hypothetical protein